MMHYLKANRRGFRRWAVSASASLLIAMAATGGYATAQTVEPVSALPDFTAIVEKTEGSVVNIRTTESVAVRTPGGGNLNDPYEMFRWFFGPDFAPPGMPAPGQRGGPRSAPAPQERTVPRGVGSGFIISNDGYILTNNHVVARANGIFVTLTSGKEYKAKVIGTDPRTDVALIKIEAKDLIPLPIGDSTKLKKGQWVLAIGSPFGLDSTVTSGIVSAINRDTGDYLPFIQTDVAVNPGNSGGPLIDLAGRVVGINSQIVSQSGGFMGISLAIPIDEVMRVVEQLKEHGKVTRGRIGVQIGPVSEDVAKAIGLEKADGAMVSNVEPGGPADDAGVRAGDVITKFDGKVVKNVSDLPRLVGETKPGVRSVLEVWRRGKTVTLRVKVGEMPAAPGEEAPNDDDGPAVGAPVDSLGLKVKTLGKGERDELKISGGVQVTQAEEPAASAGLAVGDIILAINDQDVADAAHYAKIVSGLSKSRAAAVLVQRGDQSQWLTVTPTK